MHQKSVLPNRVEKGINSDNTQTGEKPFKSWEFQTNLSTQHNAHFKDKSLYQLNLRLLKKKIADTPLQTTTGHKIYEADEKAEPFADTMENQFSENTGNLSPEVNQTITEINRDQTTSSSYVTPKQILDIINKLPNGKAPDSTTYRTGTQKPTN